VENKSKEYELLRRGNKYYEFRFQLFLKENGQNLGIAKRETLR